MKNIVFIYSLLTISICFSYRANAQVQIEGIYATSTALPFTKYSINNLFDNNSSTYWKTTPGAGPDEGVMILLNKPTYISEIKIDPIESEGIAMIERIEIYADGRTFWGSELGAKVQSIYIKISRVDHSATVRQKVEEKSYTRKVFDKDMSVAISSIKFYGEENQILTTNLPQSVKGQITASSSLMPALAYGPQNVMDYKKDVAWAEGNAGTGINEKLFFLTEKDIAIDRVKIWNGYQRSPKHFDSNARIKTFTFGIKGGVMNTYSVDDTTEPIYIKLNNTLEGKEFVLEVLDVYKGAKYEDLVLSEIRFFNNDTPIIITTSLEESRVKKNKSNSHVIFQRYLDRNIDVSLSHSSSFEKGDEYKYTSSFNSHSLIIRSNNTFVLYQTETNSEESSSEEDEVFNSDQRETIADGNWETKEIGKDYIKIRVFGKIYSPTTSAELYHGDVSSDNVRIFQDFLTLKKDKISGERYIEDILIFD